MMSQVNEFHFVIIYLGKKGGGEQLLLEFQNQLTELECDYSLVTSSEVASKFNLVSSFDFRTPTYLSDLIDVQFLFYNLKKLCNFIKALSRKSKKIIFVQVMPSPTDLIFDKMARLWKTQIYRCIHDLKPHLGESWPTENAIRRRLRNAHCIIVFSDFIGNKIKENYKTRIIKSNLPSEVYFENTEIANQIKSNTSVKPRIYVLGRAKEYKGYRNLEKALSSIKEEYTFCAFGKGEYPSNLNTFGEVHNEWLSNYDLFLKLHEADILIFPYIEASQSGLIPLAKKAGKIIVASDIGGLTEQLSGYDKAILVKADNIVDLERGIKKALNLFTFLPEFPNKAVEPKSTLVKSILLDLANQKGIIK